MAYVKLVWINFLFYYFVLAIWMPLFLLAFVGEVGDWAKAIQALVDYWYFVPSAQILGSICCGVACGVGRANKFILGMNKYGRGNLISGAAVGAGQFLSTVILIQLLSEYDPLPAHYIYMLLGFLVLGTAVVVSSYPKASPFQSTVITNEWRLFRKFLIANVIGVISTLVVGIGYYLFLLLTD
jgi:hypothetical protein